jgi:hypothetical protein
MNENVNANAQPQQLTKEQVNAIASDKELRSLRPNSPEYAAAFEKKFPSKSTPKSTSAVDDSAKKVKAEVSGTNKDSETVDKTTTDDGPSQRGIEKRIGKQKAELEMTRSENEKLKAELAALKSGGGGKAQETKAPTQPTTQFNKPQPQRKDFKSDEEYQDAKVDWKFDKKDFEREHGARVKAAVETHQTKVTKFTEAGKALEKELGLEVGAFDLTVNGEDFKTWDSTKEHLLSSEFGSQIAWEIASDEEEAAKFSKMTAIQQLTYIGRREERLEAKKQQASSSDKKQISSARAPSKGLQVGTVTGATPGFSYKPGMSQKDYEAGRLAERQARRQLGRRR